jgi:hypothetical protein
MSQLEKEDQSDQEVVVTEAMIDEGASRLAELDGSCLAYQAEEVFLAMLSARGAH